MTPVAPESPKSFAFVVTDVPAISRCTQGVSSANSPINAPPIIRHLTTSTSITNGGFFFLGDAAREQVESVIETGARLLRAEFRDAGRRQLDRERNTVQPAADLLHDAGVAIREREPGTQPGRVRRRRRTASDMAVLDCVG